MLKIYSQQTLYCAFFMLCNVVLTTFSNFYGSRHIDHAIKGSYIVSALCRPKTPAVSSPDAGVFLFTLHLLQKGCDLITGHT